MRSVRGGGGGGGGGGGDFFFFFPLYPRKRRPMYSCRCATVVIQSSNCWMIYKP